MIRRFLLALILGSPLTGAALAEPALRADVIVSDGVVTAGDIFEDAGLHDGTAMFRSPAPGTSGVVGIEAVRQAAALAGIGEFATNGLDRIRVSRRAAVVDEALLTALIEDDLRQRGVATAGTTLRVAFDTPYEAINAEAVETPARLSNLRYAPSSGAFSARFLIAGYDKPLDVGGRFDLLVDAPHLVRTLPAGSVLDPDDIEMRAVPLAAADNGGLAGLTDLVGKTLNRQSQAGILLRPSDVSVPVMIARSDIVTVVLKSGLMTLTVKGQALANAGDGELVQVLNLMSKKVLQAKAIAPGTVEIVTMQTAGL